MALMPRVVRSANVLARLPAPQTAGQLVASPDLKFATVFQASRVAVTMAVSGNPRPPVAFNAARALP